METSIRHMWTLSLWSSSFFSPFPRIHLHFYPTLLSFLQGAQLGSRHTRFWNCDSMSSWSNPGGREVESRGSRKTVALGPSDSWEWYLQGKHIFLLLILTISYGIPLSIIMASIFVSPCSALPETRLQPDEVKYEVGEEGKRKEEIPSYHINQKRKEH